MFVGDEQHGRAAILKLRVLVGNLRACVAALICCVETSQTVAHCTHTFLLQHINSLSIHH